MVCLCPAAASSIPAVSAFGIFGALVVLFNYLLVISFFPAVLVLYAKYVERCCRLRPKDEAAGQGERPSIVFLRTRVVPWMHHNRWRLLAVSSVTVAAMAASMAATARLADKLPTPVADSHPINDLINLQVHGVSLSLSLPPPRARPHARSESAPHRLPAVPVPRSVRTSSSPGTSSSLCALCTASTTTNPSRTRKTARYCHPSAASASSR